MGNRYWAYLARWWIVAVVCVFSISALFSLMFLDYSNVDAGVAGLITVLCFLVASLILGATNAIIGVVYIKTLGNAFMVEPALQDLRNAKLPPPEPWHSKNFDYLYELETDTDADTEDRIKAAAIRAAYQTTMNNKGVFFSLAFRMAIDDAILRYSQEAPRKNP